MGNYPAILGYPSVWSPLSSASAKSSTFPFSQRIAPLSLPVMGGRTLPFASCLGLVVYMKSSACIQLYSPLEGSIFLSSTPLALSSALSLFFNLISSELVQSEKSLQSTADERITMDGPACQEDKQLFIGLARIYTMLLK